MKFYEGMPGRKFAQAAPKVTMKPLPADWCPLATGHEPPLPFDNSKDRCDCTPQCPHGNPWRRQIDTLEIADGDAITDNDEAFYLMRERESKTSSSWACIPTCACSAVRSRSAACALEGQNVVLVRDLTDSMHDSLSEPLGLDHFAATDLVIDHIEKYWCPDDYQPRLPGGRGFQLPRRSPAAPGDRDWRRRVRHGPHSSGNLPTASWHRAAFARRSFTPAPTTRTIFPGSRLASADAMLVGVRRRTPKAEQLELIRRFILAAGKPVVGIRTASHAFSLRDKEPPAGYAAWPEFDAEVLGGHYTNTMRTISARQSGRCRRPRRARSCSGVPSARVRVGVVLIQDEPAGRVDEATDDGTRGRRKNRRARHLDQHHRHGGRVFYTSLGGPEDFALPHFGNC